MDEALTMADFDMAVALVLKHEGGLVDDPNDPGGLTNFGISQRSYPNVDIRNLTADDAKAIYKRDYWFPIGGDAISNQSLANAALDFAVNAGVAMSNRTMMGPNGAVGLFEFTVKRISHYASFGNFHLYAASWVRRALDY
jgi:hypothetical protein